MVNFQNKRRVGNKKWTYEEIREMSKLIMQDTPKSTVEKQDDKQDNTNNKK